MVDEYNGEVLSQNKTKNTEKLLNFIFSNIVVLAHSLMKKRSTKIKKL